MNPLRMNKRRTNRRKSARDRPENVSTWTVRNLTEYFMERYREALGIAYMPNYASDQHHFKCLYAALASNGLDKGVWGKMFVDWSIGRWETIKRERGGFYPQILVQHYLNKFLQDVIMPKVESSDIIRDKHDLSMLAEITEAERENKLMEVFARYGIPVGFTYLIRHKNMERDKAVASFRDYMTKLMATAEGRLRLESVVMASVMGSPYPQEFALRDWRTVFSDLISQFDGENWWRDADYVGKPLPKYYGLLSAEAAR